MKVLFSFFPLFNVLDVLFFGGLGAMFGLWSGRRPWLLGAAISAPTVLLSLYFLVQIGGTLWAGVGWGWAVSLILVPVSAIAGARIAAARTRAP